MSDGSAVGNDRHCLVEAFSTRDVSSLQNPKPEDTYKLDLSESFLASLIRRYPQGKIFNFAQDGTCYSSSGEENTTSGSNTESAASATRPPRDGRRLGALLPGAKTIAFYPMWDEVQDRWCSGMFVWSTSPLRYFDQTEDTTYLAAWSHSILAELARLQSVASDKAKGSFISSVSHELRSPLHGGMFTNHRFVGRNTTCTYAKPNSSCWCGVSGGDRIDFISVGNGPHNTDSRKSPTRYRR